VLLTIFKKDIGFDTVNFFKLIHEFGTNTSQNASSLNGRDRLGQVSARSIGWRDRAGAEVNALFT